MLINGDIPVADGNWHYISLIRSGTNVSLYVDGVQSGSTATNNSVSYGNAQFVIGASGQNLTLGRFSFTILKDLR